jgi:hypothetical protein
MPYITREDGEHFVIPSYRDVISVKSSSAAKKEILLLSSNYGQYITLQPKGPIQFEIACSADTGYLLGESLWYYFKRPIDMIYCEAIPNTTEAILVIVKDGSVYLDGSFPLDSIPDELIIFLTQKNNFTIYTYGDVPISETPEEGKFSFEPSSVKSFTVLDAPVFPTLPLFKPYQLQPVEQVLKAHGIGVFPVQGVVVGVVIVVVLLGMWMYMTSQRQGVSEIITYKANPYQTFNDDLTSPAPDQEINQVTKEINILITMPGWQIIQVDYKKGKIIAAVQSDGTNIQILQNWAYRNNATVDLNQKSVNILMDVSVVSRSAPTKIYPIKQSVINFIDKLAVVYPGNHLKFSGFIKRGLYYNADLTIAIDQLSPEAIGLIGEQCKGLPLALKGIKLKMDDKTGLFSGTISIEALGS